MNNKIPEQTFGAPTRKLKVLIAPLDWGLGHATRSIPIIKLLISKGCDIIIASSGPQLTLLQTEFPQLNYLQLTGYGIRYSKKWLMLRLAGQLFKIKKAINLEHKWLKDVVQTHKVDWVISDNRYGLYSPEIPCTFITHQLRVQMPVMFKWAEGFVQRQLYNYISRFSACWVPDLPDEERGLSGVLGHPAKKSDTPVWYIGWLSRFKNQTETSAFDNKCLIILSGPEPQRTMLENILLKQLATELEKVVLIRGLPGKTAIPDLPENITVYNHLPASQMQDIINTSEYLVSRSGYSTVMDAFTLQKKCIFIPTQGQTEQEYLAKRLSEKKMALVYTQDKFSLDQALKDADNFHFHFPLNSMNNLLEMAADNYIAAHFKNPTIKMMS